MAALRRLASFSRALPTQSTGFATSTKPLLLYTAGTANGRKVSVLLEELKAAYGLDYECACTTLTFL
jgi:glutathione S-transferase